MTAATAADLANETAATAVLSERLLAISPERAAATTRLLAAGDVLAREHDGARLELRPGTAQQPPHATTVRLSHAHGTVSLIMTNEHGTAAIGDRTWHDFDGDARLLAWALAYETLLERLSDLLGLSLLPVDLLAAPSTPADTWHWVEFRFEQGDHRTCQGLIGLDQTLMDALATAPGWQRGTEAGLHVTRNDLPLPCCLSLPPIFLPAAAVRDLAHQDVVLIGLRESVLSALRLRADSGERAVDASYAWMVAATPGGISISRALTNAEFRNDMTMNQDSPDDPIPSAGEAKLDIRDAIPLRVELVLDTLNLSLAELDRVSAGQILSLGQPVDSANVGLRVNGKTFAIGQLVSLGDLLGVKITRIGDDLGLQ